MDTFRFGSLSNPFIAFREEQEKIQKWEKSIILK